MNAIERRTVGAPGDDAGAVGSFAAIAVELGIGKTQFGELSFAAAILSMMRADNLYRLERVAAEIGLDVATARAIIINEQRFAALIAEAHRLFKAMIPAEAEIRTIIARSAP